VSFGQEIHANGSAVSSVTYVKKAYLLVFFAAKAKNK
jgi:hypothetical protein